MRSLYFLYRRILLICSLVFLWLMASYLAEGKLHSKQYWLKNFKLFPLEKNHNIQRRMINNKTMNPVNDENINDEIYANKSYAHNYYNSTFITSPDIVKKYWVDLTNEKTVTDDLLSNSHRRITTVQLSFDFPFYGQTIRNVTIATGGFISTSKFMHSWLEKSQYIAPLKANFDTSLSTNSYIKYLDNGTSFTVQWENVSLRDNRNEEKLNDKFFDCLQAKLGSDNETSFTVQWENLSLRDKRNEEKLNDKFFDCLQAKLGSKEKFTFQATLHKNGDIVFAYLNVPEIIKSIRDDYHPVIGLSDAYIMENIGRMTILEYLRINFAKEYIKNSSVIYFTALPTCVGKYDWYSCVENLNTAYKCAWCPATAGYPNMDMVDRFRQE